MIGWEGIEEAVAVDSAGSFAGAAAQLDTSTSHVSRAVARLESRLQVQIFARTTRRVAVTEGGRAIIDKLRTVIERRDEAFASAATDGKPRGHIKLTSSIALGDRFIVPIVRQFAVDHPDVAITIDLTNRIVDLVAENYDIAIRTGALADSRLIARRIGSRRLLVCAAPVYLAGRGSPDTVEDLNEHDCLIGASLQWSFNVGGTALSYRPKGRWRCNSGPSILDAATAGMGVCQLPDFYLHQAIADGKLVTVLDDFEPPEEPIWAIHPQSRHVPPSIRILLEHLKLHLPRALSAVG